MEMNNSEKFQSKSKADIIISVNDNFSNKNLLFKSQSKRVQNELFRNDNIKSLMNEIEVKKKYIKQTTNNLPEILKFDKTKEFFNLTDVRNFNDAIRNDTDEKLTDSEISSDLENLPLNQGI